MKILLSTIIFLIPLSIYAELVCPSLGGCPIDWETGICKGCIESKVKVKKSIKPSPTFTELQKPVKDNTNPYYQSFYDPDYKHEKKVVSNLSLDNGGNIQRGIPKVINILTDPIHGRIRHSIRTEMVKIVPFSPKKLPFLVNRSRTRIALCKSGCKSSRWATMGFFREGFYWIRK